MSSGVSSRRRNCVPNRGLAGHDEMQEYQTDIDKRVYCMLMYVYVQ
jgi:hypothetical protein